MRLFFAFLFVCACHPAIAVDRVALVIGNSTYARVGLPANPKTVAVAAALRGHGFQVIEKLWLCQSHWLSPG